MRIFSINNRKYFKNYLIFISVLPSLIILFLSISINGNNIFSYAIEANNSSSTDDCINNSENPNELQRIIEVEMGTLFFWYQCTVPSIIHVGDYFTIYALVWPITHKDIEIKGNGPLCGNPLTVQFDKNVKINEIQYDEHFCNLLTSKYIVKTGQWLTLSTSPFANLPAGGITSYLATSAGKTNGTMELKYREAGNSSIVSLKSLPFELNILPLSNSTTATN